MDGAGKHVALGMTLFPLLLSLVIVLELLHVARNIVRVKDRRSSALGLFLRRWNEAVAAIWRKPGILFVGALPRIISYLVIVPSSSGTGILGYITCRRDKDEKTAVEEKLEKYTKRMALAAWHAAAAQRCWPWRHR